MTSHFKIIALALLVSGCSALESKLTHYSEPLLEPPDVIGVHCVCDKPEELLICTDESVTDCQGFLKDKPLITIEETEL